MSNSLIELNNIDVYLSSKLILDKINLLINKGEHVAIIGSNGSGKSTLINLISADGNENSIVRALKGDNSYMKLFAQERYNIWDIKKKISVVTNNLQEKYKKLSGYSTGLEVVCSGFNSSIGFVNLNNLDNLLLDKANNIMKKFNIESLKNKKICNMSTGQMRKILIARSLINSPEVFILDEPTNGLDPKAQIEFVNFMEELTKKEENTMILVTHYINEIIPSINRVIGLKNGKILFDGEKDKVLSNKNISELFNANFSVIKNKKGYYYFIEGEI